jgi:DNA-binding response OmpR family regulator
MERTSRVQSTIMIVEDNPLIVEFVVAYLRREDFNVLIAEGCNEALSHLQTHQPDLILLDVVLDDGSGYDLCKTLRTGGEDGTLSRLADTPILLLTARADEEDRLKGFQAGADDYVTKPFSPNELMLRIQAILRRSHGVSNGMIEIGALRVNPRQREVTVDDQSVPLTPKEFDLLHLLASRPGCVFSREELLERIWGYSYFGNTRTVDVHVNRLRQKLAIYPPCGEMISTVWGSGYHLVPESHMQKVMS